MTENIIKVQLKIQDSLKISGKVKDILYKEVQVVEWVKVKIIQNGYFIEKKAKKPIEYDYTMREKIPRQLASDSKILSFII